MTFNLVTKRLDNPSYADDCVALRADNPIDIDGLPLQSPAYARHFVENQYLVPDNYMYRCYGVVDSDTGKLWAYGLQKLLTDQRAWVLVLVVSDQNATNGLLMNGLGGILDAMIEHAESLKYYRYFTVTPVERAESHDRVWSKISKQKGDRYVSCIEEQFPERTVNAFGMYWDDIMGGAMFEKPACIRHVFLLPEHRQFAKL